MTFEEKISGTKVSDFSIDPIFNDQLISLDDVIALDLSQRTMNYILDTLRFYRGERDKTYTGSIWWTTMDFDTIYKISIMENYPKYEKELTNYFGEDWYKHYIRFNH